MREQEDLEDEVYSDSARVSSTSTRPQSERFFKEPQSREPIPKTQFPASISIGELLRAGKLIKPESKTRVALQLESFDVATREWIDFKTLDLAICTQKFSSGAFRDAFKAISKGNADDNENIVWVVKTYNAKAKKTIVDTLASTLEEHARKQVQMHAVARHIAKRFTLKVPPQFGKTSMYNRVYYTKYSDEPATVEEYIGGDFMKYVNNNGYCINPPMSCSEELTEVFEKAQCFVHYSYHASGKELMVLDIQGSKYNIYDPEIATKMLVDEDASEMYFCCGNLSEAGINNFLELHTCNKFCRMLVLPEEKQTNEEK